MSLARRISLEPGVTGIQLLGEEAVRLSDPLDLLDVAVCPRCLTGFRILGGLPWAA